jgi:hypothetical protein
MHGRLLASATSAVLGLRDPDPMRMEQVPRERRLMHGQQHSAPASTNKLEFPLEHLVGFRPARKLLQNTYMYIYSTKVSKLIPIGLENSKDSNPNLYIYKYYY